MKPKQFQLAHIYRRDRFIGYGLAVDGELIAGQQNSVIETLPGQSPTITICFHLNKEIENNSIKVQV